MCCCSCSCDVLIVAEVFVVIGFPVPSLADLAHSPPVSQDFEAGPLGVCVC